MDDTKAPIICGATEVTCAADQLASTTPAVPSHTARRFVCSARLPQEVRIRR